MLLRLPDFLGALWGYWYLLVTGGVFVTEQFIETYLPNRLREWLDSWWPKDRRPRHFRWAAAAMIFVSCYLAFDDMNQRFQQSQSKVSKLTDERDEARRLFGVPASSAWAITPEHQKAIKDALVGTLERFHVDITTVSSAGNNAVDAAYKLMNAFGGVTGWTASVNPLGDSEFSPSETGLMVAVRAGTDPTKNKKAMTLKELLDKADLKPRFSGHNQLPANEAKIVFGKLP